MPKTKAAKKYSVSGSYLTRVCTTLRVPRPPKGYWAKLEVGKAPARPALPETLPGDQLLWSQEGDTPVPRTGAEMVTTVAPQPRLRRLITGTHGLIRGAKRHYETGLKVDDGQLLRPLQRLLVDVSDVHRPTAGQRTCSVQNDPVSISASASGASGESEPARGAVSEGIGSLTTM